jgi:hypothetical protein
MKKIFAVAMLLMSLASVAVADGAGGAPPPKSIEPLKAVTIQMADGAGSAPPPKSIEPLKAVTIQMADGAGGAPPPIKSIKPSSSAA